MISSDISFWGVSLLVVLLLASVAVYWLIDRKEMMRVLRVFGLMVGEMAVIDIIAWTACKANAWWADMLWFVVLVALATGWCLYKMRKTWKRMLMPVVAALTDFFAVEDETQQLEPCHLRGNQRLSDFTVI